MNKSECWIFGPFLFEDFEFFYKIKISLDMKTFRVFIA